MAHHIATNSWRKTTLARLSSCTRKWIDFCLEHKQKKSDFSAKKALAFLNYLHTDRGNSYYALKDARYFLVSIAKINETPYTANDMQLISRYMKGIFNANPPITRTPSSTWNVDMVLDHFTIAGPNTDIPLNTLAGKVALLILLTRMCRVGEVAQLDTQSMIESEESLTFYLNKPVKNCTPSNVASTKNLHAFVLRRFPNEMLCPVSALKTYLQRTEKFREDVTKVFIIISQKIRPASVSSVSRWVKDIMTSAGVADYFGTHSSRAAASTCALLLGLSVDSILKQAGWTSKHTFVKYYMKNPCNNVTDSHSFSDNWRPGSGGERLLVKDKDVKVHNFLNTHSSFSRQDKSRSQLTQEQDRSYSLRSKTAHPIPPPQTEVKTQTSRSLALSTPNPAPPLTFRHLLERDQQPSIIFATQGTKRKSCSPSAPVENCANTYRMNLTTTSQPMYASTARDAEMPSKQSKLNKMLNSSNNSEQQNVHMRPKGQGFTRYSEDVILDNDITISSACLDKSNNTIAENNVNTHDVDTVDEDLVIEVELDTDQTDSCQNSPKITDDKCCNMPLLTPQKDTVIQLLLSEDGTVCDVVKTEDTPAENTKEAPLTTQETCPKPPHTDTLPSLDSDMVAHTLQMCDPKHTHPLFHQLQILYPKDSLIDLLCQDPSSLQTRKWIFTNYSSQEIAQWDDVTGHSINFKRPRIKSNDLPARSCPTATDSENEILDKVSQ